MSTQCNLTTFCLVLIFFIGNVEYPGKYVLFDKCTRLRVVICCLYARVRVLFLLSFSLANVFHLILLDLVSVWNVMCM